MDTRKIVQLMRYKVARFCVEASKMPFLLKKENVVDSDALWITPEACPTDLGQPLRGCPHYPQHYCYFRNWTKKEKTEPFIDGEK